MKKTIGITLAIMIVTSLLAGCGERVEDDRAEKVQTSEMKTAQEDGVMPESEPEEVEEPTEEAVAGDEEQELTLGDNGSMEIYAGRDSILLSDDMIVGQVTVEDILQGNPILYDRYKADGFVFEWIVSDYEYENIFLEDGK